MARSYRRRFGLVVGLGVALLAGQPGLARAQSCEPQVARAVSVQGTVEARRAQAATWQPVKLNDAFCPGDTIRVQERSRANLALLDQSVLRLNAGATITVEAVKDERTAVVDLAPGGRPLLQPRAAQPGREDAVHRRRRPGHRVLRRRGARPDPAHDLRGERGGGEPGRQPRARQRPVGRRRARQGAGGPGRGTPAGRRPVGALLPARRLLPPGRVPGRVRTGRARSEPRSKPSRAGDIQRAFDGIRNVPETVPDPRFFAYRASLLLAVGRVDEAGADIQRALRLRANDPNALASRRSSRWPRTSRTGRSRSPSRRSRPRPTPATARIALSYAQQARFDLEGARASLEEAVEREPRECAGVGAAGRDARLVR